MLDRGPIIYSASLEEKIKFLSQQGYTVKADGITDEVSLKNPYSELELVEMSRTPYRAERELEGEILDAIKCLINEIPDTIVVPLLYWISYEWSLEAQKRGIGEDQFPSCFNMGFYVGLDGFRKYLSFTENTLTQVREGLVECYRLYPKLFFENVSLLCPRFFNAISIDSIYNSNLRMVRFIEYHSPFREDGWNEVNRAVQYYNKEFLKSGSQSSVGALVITVLSTNYFYPRHSFRRIFKKWPTLLKKDTAQLEKYKNKKQLYLAAEKSLKRPIYSLLDIVMEIDRLTGYEYIQRRIKGKYHPYLRDNYYRRIAYHMEKNQPKKSIQAKNHSFSVSEDFFYLTKKLPELKSCDYAEKAISRAQDDIDKLKKALARGKINLTKRVRPKSISIRLHEPFSKSLDRLVKKLHNSEGLPGSSNRSVAIELIIRYADYKIRRPPSRNPYSRSRPVDSEWLEAVLSNVQFFPADKPIPDYFHCIEALRSRGRS